jgi:hypothetical protein
VSYELEVVIISFSHPEGTSTVVPSHVGETIGPGLLHKILRDCQITVERLSELL